ncbi:BnaC08g45930D [Brassica napus]|uniref:(rape) hypothetical protein n=1 Tax=Brassica napus TaxID=3708 RepID=A0A078HGJ4_BRANA|nr:unnamed protein product [Brassica napus]CDY37455.1 BnaC08g45930D [Brassica napus]
MFQLNCITSKLHIFVHRLRCWMSKCGKFQCLKDILDVLEFNIFFEDVKPTHLLQFSKIIAENVSPRSETLQLVCVVVD